MIRVIILAMCFCIVACDIVDDVNETAIEVDERELTKYWIQQNQRISFGSADSVAKKQAGHVRLRYLIDNNGKVQDPQIVSSTPEGMWDSTALSALQQFSYYPAENNSNNQAVYTYVQFSFTAE